MKRILIWGWILLLFIVCSPKSLLAQTEETGVVEDISLLEQVEKRFNISGFMTFQYQEFDLKSSDNTLKDMINDSRELLARTLDHGGARAAEWSFINTKVRDTLEKFYYERTKRRPMILPFMVKV